MRTIIVLFALAFAGLGVIAVSNIGETPAEAEALVADKQNSRALYDAEWAAIEACRAQVLSKAAIPGKADFYAAVTALSDDAINWSVAGIVDLMNGFGAMIPHRYGCIVHGSDIVSSTLRPS